MFGTTTALPARIRPSDVSSAGNGNVAISRCSASNGQKGGLAARSVRSGRVGGCSLTPVRMRALAPVSGSRRQRRRTLVQAPPAVRSGTRASRSCSSNSITATPMTLSGRITQPVLVGQIVELALELVVNLVLRGRKAGRELPRVARPDDWRGDGLVRQHPGDRERHQVHARLLRDLVQSFDGVEFAIVPVALLVVLRRRAEREAC